MTIVRSEYLELAPQGRYLSDVVVLSQAWKKSHAFIRRHNWYADVLELDVSTIDLEARLLAWSMEAQSQDFLPAPLLLVPAPKNARWEFAERAPLPSIENLMDVNWDDLGPDPAFDDWRPKSANSASTEEGAASAQKLRPLAHLCIRDQTLATAVMMCLAEAIESAQGDSGETDLWKAREAGTVSYGNRLDCRWKVTSPDHHPRADFSWGNGRTYRQYFQDYRLFLARPRRICAELVAQVPKRRELFVVSLDIKSFFDCIDTTALVGELRKFELEHRTNTGNPQHLWADDVFWARTTRIFAWKWRDEDQVHAPLIREADAKTLNLGLPQGLVASGFLANAYMIGFDRAMHQAVTSGKTLSGEVKILDYSRYVDDIRIVVEAPAQEALLNGILAQVVSFVEAQLTEHCKRIEAKHVLKLSSEDHKRTITPYRSISAQSNMSALMDVLNAELSGTFDLESLVQAAGGLDGLLWMADQIEERPEPKGSRMRLATVAVPSTDVRDDTVKRFVATRLAQMLRHRLAMADVTAPAEREEALVDGISEGAVIAHEFESTARKLVKCWAENPSLALLLRCGMDLYPHPALLAPVVEALTVKLFGAPTDLDLDRWREVRVSEYVSADLLRAGAVETGYRDSEEYPDSVDIAGYRQDLGAFARRIISERATSPWYLLQQAYLYLSSIGDFSLAAHQASMPPEIAAYVELQRSMMYAPAHSARLVTAIPLALVGQQLTPDSRRFAVWLREGLRNTDDEKQQEHAVRTIVLSRPDLVLEAIRSTRGVRAAAWKKYVPTGLIDAARKPPARRSTEGRQAPRSLTQVMASDENIFGQENGLLMLARSLLQQEGIEDRLANGLTPSDIVLECAAWDEIQALPTEAGFIQVTMAPSETHLVTNPMYQNPPWVADDKAWLYGLGRILRAALTGEFDFTTRRYLVTEDVGRYKGLRSTWYKRRFGLLNSARGLMDEPSPVSPWLSGFLSTLLQWPGVEFRAQNGTAAGEVRTRKELLKLLDKRITEQRALFGRRSRTPMYVVPTDDSAPLRERLLRVAIVQPMRPRSEEFDTKDPIHWTAGVLAAHRRHLAEVCRLANQKLRTWASAKGIALGGKSEDDAIVDVILFPELAVHPEHVFLLRRLSDKLRASIFTGLTFVHSHKRGGPVNQGLWMIRTASPAHGRSIQYVWQGKKHPMKLELEMGIKGHRPHLTLLELPVGTKTRTRIAAAICYDATDLDLVADLREKSDMFLVAALNQDVQTFDNMVAALHFHMYQPVVLANMGQFGGSTAQIPLPQPDRLIAHVHGNNQVAVSVFEVDPAPFKSTAVAKAPRKLKYPPAGYKGRPA
ncbi:RNA-directed DNA polymerase [Ramlibacter alkalitolerans]|uniref:RNA-directed DNA polymerase n=2 Tax=Ramlibacter alkalitolerans TaxID=2039631 RepID=A0ABS1JMD2_9BURK|nr:RNA-directed DNA polymerase [Ramlibacter alkalitolerans]